MSGRHFKRSIAAAEILTMADTTILPGTRGHVQKDIDSLMLQGSQGDGAETFSEGVLTPYNKSSDEIVRE